MQLQYCPLLLEPPPPHRARRCPTVSHREALRRAFFHKRWATSSPSLPIQSKSVLGKLAFNSKHFVLDSCGRDYAMPRSAGRGIFLQGKAFMRFPFHEASCSNSPWLHRHPSSPPPAPHRGPFPNLKTGPCNLRRNAEI